MTKANTRMRLIIGKNSARLSLETHAAVTNHTVDQTIRLRLPFTRPNRMKEPGPTRAQYTQSWNQQLFRVSRISHWPHSLCFSTNLHDREPLQSIATLHYPH